MAEQEDGSKISKARVKFYGLKNRARALRLVDALAAIGCVPVLVVRADKFGNLFAIHDKLREQDVLYVRVRRWLTHKPSPALPVIDWSTRGDQFGRGVWARVSATMRRRMGGVGQKPDLTIDYDLKRHAELHAKKVAGAS